MPTPAAAAALLSCTARRPRLIAVTNFVLRTVSSNRGSQITMFAIITVQLIIVRLSLSVDEAQYIGK